MPNIKQYSCIRCSEQASQQYKLGDEKTWKPICAKCGRLLNNTVRKLMEKINVT